MIKTVNKLGMERNFLNVIKSVYKNPTANTTLEDERLKAFPPRSRNDTVSVLNTSVQHWTESSSQGIKIGKEDIKLFLFTDDIILYIESANKPTKKLLKLISKFNKAAITIQELIVFLYSNND